MKVVVIEPIGVSKDIFFSLASSILPNDAELIYYETRTTDTQQLIARGKDADIIVVSNLPLNQEVLEGCPNLKMLAVAFTGVDHIALETCKERGITICNASGYSNAAVSDLVFGMIISLYRQLSTCNEVVREGGTKEGLIGFELENKKFGIIGTGAIGLKVATIAKAFGCEVYAYSRTQKPDTGLIYTDLDTLLKTCDIVSLHVPLTEETKHLINEEKLSLMKPNALLINTARGPVMDPEALLTALNTHQIAGAGIDVFDIEPPLPTDHILCKAPCTLLTPHIGFATQEALEKRAIITLDNIAHFLKGAPKNVIL